MIYVDMDAYFASVEQRDHPYLRGRPTLVTHKVADPERSNYGVVIAASYEARRLGLRAGTTVLEAKRVLGRRANFVKADFPKYLEVCRQLYHVCEQIGPTEAASVDEFYLEAAGLRRRFGFELFAAARLKQLMRQRLDLPATAGVGYSKLSAKMAAEAVKPEGIAELACPQQFLERFRHEPVTQVPGIARRLARSLRSLSIYTIGELAAADPLRLVKRYGVNGWALSRAGQGYGGGPLEPGLRRQRVRSVGHSTTLRGVSDMEKLKVKTLGLCEGIARRLRAQDLAGRTVYVSIGFDRSFSRREQVTLAQPAALAGPFYAQACRLLEQHRRLVHQWGVTHIAISVSGLRHGLQLSFDGERDWHLAFACDAIERRFGPGAIKRCSLKDFSHAPAPRGEVA